jgi:transcriptional regulator with XRE-family HTH domain
VISDDEIGKLVRRLRRRQGLSRPQLSDRVVRISGDRMDPAHLRQWEAGKAVPNEYWRGWLGEVFGVPREVLDRAAAIAHDRRQAGRRP